MQTKELQTILAPTDFSETASHALDCAIDIARKSNSKLVLVHVVDTLSRSTPAEMMSIGMITEQMMIASLKEVKKLASSIKKKHKIKVDAVNYSGVIYESIIRAAHLYNADLIVMGSHGKSGVFEWFFGNNSLQVVNNTTIPVLTINQKSDITGFSKIVFPFNSNLLTLKKPGHVIPLAQLMNASVLLLGFSDINNVSEQATILQKGKQLSELFKKEGIGTTLNLVNGSSYVEEIIGFATREKASMVSIATTRTHDVNKVFKKSERKTLLTTSSIPILSVPV